MSSMDPFDRSILRMEELQRESLQIPAWARAEKLEYVVPQSIIWKAKHLQNTAWKQFCRWMRSRKK